MPIKSRLILIGWQDIWRYSVCYPHCRLSPESRRKLPLFLWFNINSSWKASEINMILSQRPWLIYQLVQPQVGSVWNKLLLNYFFVFFWKPLKIRKRIQYTLLDLEVFLSLSLNGVVLKKLLADILQVLWGSTAIQKAETFLFFHSKFSALPELPPLSPPQIRPWLGSRKFPILARESVLCVCILS